MKLRVSGIYDPETISYLKQFGVGDFVFDLRPTSFNFIQTYKVKEILEQSQLGLDNFYLKFENEKDFVIHEIVKDIITTDNSVVLEFSGNESLDFCEQFGVPYVWHFNETVNYEKLGDMKYLKMVSLKNDYLEWLNNYSDLYKFLGQFLLKLNPNQNIELNLDWHSSVMETLIDFFNFKFINYEINNKVEKSFRNVDLHLVSTHIEHTRRTLNF